MTIAATKSPLAYYETSRARLLYQINADGGEWFAPDLTDDERMRVDVMRAQIRAGVQPVQVETEG